MKGKRVKQSSLIPVERIEKAIYSIRGEKVMLDRDLAALYETTTKVLKQAVRRNIARFPDDFMFVLNPTEFQTWRSQFVTSNADRIGLRYSPMAFTEHGILMLSSVLNSTRCATAGADSQCNLGVASASRKDESIPLVNIYSFAKRRTLRSNLAGNL